MIPLIIALWVACGLGAAIWAIIYDGTFRVGDILVMFTCALLGPIAVCLWVGFYIHVKKDVIIWKKGGGK